MTKECYDLVEDCEAVEIALLERFDQQWNGLLPDEYLQMIKNTDGGILRGGKARFLSLSDRYPYGERVWEMNEPADDVPLLIIGHFCSETCQCNFGYKLDEMAREVREVCAYDSESGEVWRESDSLDEFIKKYAHS